MQLTTKQAAAAAAVSPSSIRLYCREYSDYLSPGATPAPGQTRLFAPEDVQVFSTVAVLRARSATSDQILETLAAGERYAPDPPQEDEAAQEDEASQRQQPSLEAAAAMALQVVRGHVAALEDERDYLRDQLDQERAARIDAERRAAALEAIAAQAGLRRPSWLARLMGRE